MGADESPGFSVVDKRRTAQAAEKPKKAAKAKVKAETAKAEPDSAAEEPIGAAPESSPEYHQGDLPELTLRDRMLMCIDILHQSAWVNLGLVADPASGEVTRDLGSARIAIDSVAFLADRIEPRLDEATAREIKRVVSDLQINFVRQSQKPS